MSDAIRYADEPSLGVDEFVDVLRRSTLAERRPIDDRGRIARMLDRADIRLCARDAAGLLVGVSRALTDFAYCRYLTDLAVDAVWQRRGIGRELIRRTHALAGPGTQLILLAAPKAMSYYPHVGLTRSERAFTIERR
ncbi:MAG: GNAT family N-acetyltransferase [Alphaproteobacteria bacterium]|nr:GNAT family N-acetyltransferase [Alphaproteobacteria bacterium]